MVSAGLLCSGLSLLLLGERGDCWLNQRADRSVVDEAVHAVEQQEVQEVVVASERRGRSDDAAAAPITSSSQNLYSLRINKCEAEG